MQYSATLASYKIGVFSGGIRTSGLEVLPKGELMVLPMQSGAVKGSTQGAYQHNSCGASQESTGYNEMSQVGEDQAGRARGAS